MYPIFNQTLLSKKKPDDPINAEEWLPCFKYPHQKGVEALKAVKTAGDALQTNKEASFVKACYAFPARVSKASLCMTASRECVVVNAVDFQGTPLDLSRPLSWSQIPVDTYKGESCGKTFEEAVRMFCKGQRYFILYAVAFPSFRFKGASYVEREGWYSPLTRVPKTCRI